LPSWPLLRDLQPYHGEHAELQLLYPKACPEPRGRVPQLKDGEERRCKCGGLDLRASDLGLTAMRLSLLSSYHILWFYG
jgi:hypothetical protein